ncbi:MAG: hypothetical protein V3T86_01495 [Planctomycetota bacterium]
MDWVRDFLKRLWGCPARIEADPPARRLLAVFLTLDLVFMATTILHYLHYSHGLGPDFTGDKNWGVGFERSYPELFNYAQVALLVGLLAFTWARSRSPAYLVAMLVFLIVLLDDSLSIHEIWGAWLVHEIKFGPHFGLAAQEIGELMTWCGFGVLLVVPLVWASRRADRRSFAECGVLAGLFGVLLVFAIGVDFVGSTFGKGTEFQSFLYPLIEDGGEMIVLSYTTAFALRLARESKTGPTAA